MVVMARSAALKEWAVAVDALLAGETIVLLRKGGIREVGGKFSVPHRQVWLYPTYEHQQPHLLKAGYADRVQAVPSGWHPEAVEIKGWATVTHLFCVSEPAIVEALLPFHIWNQQFVAERLKWKPRSPLWILLLQAYGLPQPETIPFREAYGGCRSWLDDLQVSLAAESARPVLSESAYQAQVNQIEAIVTSCRSSVTAE